MIHGGIVEKESCKNHAEEIGNREEVFVEEQSRSRNHGGIIMERESGQGHIRDTLWRLFGAPSG